MHRLIARWNPARGVWETDQAAVCGHLVPFLETWPTSGMTRDGVAYELPTSAPRTEGSGSSSSPGLLPPRAARGGSATETARLLPTPDAYEGSRGGSQPPEKLKAGGHSTNLASVAEWDLLPTPRATDGTKGGPNQRGSSGDMMLPSAVRLLPTPTVHHPAADTRNPQERLESDHQMELSDVVRLLPTPTAMDSKASGGSGASDVTLTDAMVRGKLLPTPMTSYSARSAEAWRAGRPAGNGKTREQVGDLRIVVEELLPGGHTSPPSDDGNEPSDE